MAEKFGQISTGMLAEDENIKQGFLDVEKHLNDLNNLSSATDTDFNTFKSSVGTVIDSSLKSLTSSTSVENLASSSSNADIVAALQNKGTEITNIVTALQNMSAKIKGLS